ncbi:AurF N-oxygenase family protein [Williamsia deligens]|uniref:Diiron oxygenase n=1 Tax=Williamsia deligens TaxID=321325 RepID=A0ABW3G5W9_9NOCA|nr:diiron oxygenase [Williamsia deligens]MCP2193646.1 P-aminobenzoate N-oxygenase AurF [Williamsia deligens]
MTIDSVAPIPVSADTIRSEEECQALAERLLRSTADRAYDGDLDIDWDAPVDPDKPWATEHRGTLYGTEIYESLTDEQKLLLSRAEAVAILTYGINAEIGLCTNLLRGVFAGRDFSDATTLYSLSEIAEETRHSTMFGRLITKTGMEPFRRPKALSMPLRLIGFIPHGPVVYAGTLLVEEVLDRVQRESMADERIQPHVRQLMKIHVLEEARHITFARNELADAIARSGPVSLAVNRVLCAALTLFVMPTLVDSQAYRAAGIGQLRGWIAAQRSPRYRENATFMCGPMLRYFHEAGLIKGRVTTALYRASRALPDDVLAAVRAEENSR